MKYALFILSFTILLISCERADQNSTFHRNTLSGNREGISWEVDYDDKVYYFTDRINLHLSLYADTDYEFFLDEKSDAGLWGDFRVFSLSNKSRGQWILTVQPRQTGESVLRFPVISWEGEEDLFLFPDIIIDIQSRLKDKNQEIYPLIQNKQEMEFPFMVPVAVLSLALLLLVPAFFIVRKKRTAGKRIGEEQESLIRFLREINEDSPGDLQELYRKMYTLLLGELDSLHPAVQKSDSPGELMDHLEIPSALNQWGLRGLYPVLERMNSLFFLPGPHELTNEIFRTDRKTVEDWIQLNEAGKPEDKDVL